MATYEYFLEEVVQHIQMRSFKNGDAPRTGETLVYAKLFQDASVGDSPSRSSL